MPESNPPSLWDMSANFLLTMASTIASRTLTFPLNTAVFRYQKYSAPVHLDNVSDVLFGAGTNHYMARLRALYSGFGAKLFESTTKKTIKILIQPTIERQLEKYTGVFAAPYIQKQYYDILFAGLSGALLGGVSLTAYPFEQIVYQKRSFNHPSRTTWQIIRAQQRRELLRGFWIALPRSMVGNAIPFAVIKATENEEYSQLKATAISVVLNAALTSPFEVLLEDRRDNPSSTERAYQRAKRIFQTEGILGFYRGSAMGLFAKGLKQALPVVVASTVLKKREEAQVQKHTAPSL